MDIKYINIDSLGLLERVDEKTCDLVFIDPPFGFRYEYWGVEFNVEEYLELISRVLQQSHRVLKNTGSVVVNINPVFANEYRSLLDAIFGKNNYRQEIVIPRKNVLWNDKAPKKTGHLIFLIYSKTDKFKYTPATRPYTQNEIDFRFPLSDDRGRYRLERIFIPGKYHQEPFEWKGFLPPENTNWRYSKEKLDQLWENGNIKIPSDGNYPRYKRYFRDDMVIMLGNIWDDVNPNVIGKERVEGFVGQLPVELVKRLLTVYTEQGDLVCDPFAGVATTCVAALELNRRCLACDDNEEVFILAKKRLDYSDVRFVKADEYVEAANIVHNTYSYISSTSFEFEKINFIKGQPLDFDEDLSVEYKEIKGGNPAASIKSLADQYAVAFLNASGGKIYWGIRDEDKVVVGVELSYGQRDEIRRVVSEKTASIKPLISPAHFKLRFHNVRNNNRKLSNVFVVELEVDNIQGKDLFFTGSNDCYIKTVGGKKKLAGPQIQSEVMRRYGLNNSQD